MLFVIKNEKKLKKLLTNQVLFVIMFKSQLRRRYIRTLKIKQRRKGTRKGKRVKTYSHQRDAKRSKEGTSVQ